jgi:hypothetical protein
MSPPAGGVLLASRRVVIPWRPGLAAAGFVAVSGWSAGARAQPSGWGSDLGMFVGFHFGSGIPLRFGAGLEARRLYGRRDLDCNGDTARYAGVMARLQVVGWEQVRLVAGPQTGRHDQFKGVGIELGVGYRFGRDPGLLGQAGLEGSVASTINARLGYAFGGEWSADTGVRFPPFVPPGCSVVGRPVRRGDGRAPLAAALVLPPGRRAPADDDARARAAAVWIRRARSEWASAPAFCELAEQLVACGAPATLAQRAREAAGDELRHALLASSVAATLAGAEVRLEPPVADGRPAATGEEGLRRLAVESWIDGCLGEGAAAAVAAAEAEAAHLPSLRHSQRTIAADEARHAELAWDVLGWSLAAGGSGVRAALARIAAHAPPAETRPVDDGAPGHACLSSRDAGLIVERQGAHARARLAALVGA